MDDRQTNKVEVGTFDVLSGEVVVSDPCYDLTRNPDLGHTQEATNGTYHAVIEKELGIYGRVRRLYALREGFDEPDALTLREVAGVGVDSGQMSICDAMANHASDSAWYDMVCEITLDYEGNQSGVFEGGCASSSGYGDGYYPVYECLDERHENVGWCVIFIYDDDDDSF